MTFQLPSGTGGSGYRPRSRAALSLWMAITLLGSGIYYWISRSRSADAPSSVVYSTAAQESPQISTDRGPSAELDHIGVHLLRLQDELTTMAKTATQIRGRMQQIHHELGDDTTDYQKQRIATAEAYSASMVSTVERARAELKVLQEQFVNLQREK